MISAQQVAVVVNDKQSLHESLRRNQLYCPKLKETIMTVQFMKGCIGNRYYWLPKTEDIRIRNCVDPPPRGELARLVYEKMAATAPSGDACFDGAFRRTAQELARKPPNTEWLLAMLSTMDPNHGIFAKDWVRPRVNRAAEYDGDTDMVENIDGWFDGLPVAKQRRGAPIKLVQGNSAAAEAHRLQRMQEKSAALQMKIQQHHAKMARLSQPQPSFSVASTDVSGVEVSAFASNMNASVVHADSAVFDEAESLPVAGNVIGNLSDVDEDAVNSMAGLSMGPPNRSHGRVPASLVKTRHERKQISLMVEAWQRAQAALAKEDRE